jgi:tetratricopeptide (TPR) repeat protein
MDPMILRDRTSALLALTFVTIATAATAQQPRPMTIAGLGTITFPASTHSRPADSAFIRGVLLLHLFEYDDAAASFRTAQRLDPGMVMAYWGEAMTFTHPVWDEQDSVAARAVLAKLGPNAAAREARAGTPTERGFVQAVDVLYGPGPKAKRDTLYASAMAELLRQHPRDDEVRSFYALSLLGLSQGVREVPTYLHAAAIAESVFVRNPKHAGAAHYWIHGMDDPDHAAGALRAARALSAIAPDAGHAQHMTSHIFLALGMWDDVVRANINAMRVVNRARRAAGRPETSCGHYNFWLEYGELQQGRQREARTLVEGCLAQAAVSASSNALDPDSSPMGSAVGMWARYLLDTEEWTGELAGWAPSSGLSDPARITWLFVRGAAAARRGDMPTARQALTDYQATHERLTGRYRASTDPNDAEYLKRLAVLGLQLRADILLATESSLADSAVSLLRRAAAIEDGMAYAFGPPFVDKPSHERLGEVLLAQGKAADARREFEAALKTTPNRALAKRGLARATGKLAGGL